MASQGNLLEPESLHYSRLRCLKGNGLIKEKTALGPPTEGVWCKHEVHTLEGILIRSLRPALGVRG